MLINEYVSSNPAAKWISNDGEAEINEIRTVWFRKTFECDGRKRIKIHISACSRYKLYVNQMFAAYGPCKGGAGYQFFDDVELTDHLQAGINELLVEVVFYPDADNDSTCISGPGWAVNLLRKPALAVIGETDYGEDISTGTSEWLCCSCDAMTPVRNTVAVYMRYTEKVDLSKTVRMNCAEKLRWELAHSCEDIAMGEWGKVLRLPPYERPIPLMSIGERKRIVNSPRGKVLFESNHIFVENNTHFEIDLDADVEHTAFIYLSGTGGKAAKVRMIYSEAYSKDDGSKSDRLYGKDKLLAGYADEIYLDGGNFEYSPFCFRTFRFLKLEIETAEDPLILFAPEYVETNYPLNVVSCIHQDPSGLLRPIWELGLRTLKCCLHETFEDCPYYEQLQYTMDSRLEILFMYRVSADVRLANRAIFDFNASRLPNGILQSRYPSSSKQVIPTYSLYWILMLHDYYVQTGDKQTLYHYFGIMHSILRYFHEHKDSNGLIANLGYWEFIDWVDEWERGVPEMRGVAEGTKNFMYAYALGIAAQICHIIGYSSVGEQYAKEKEEILTLTDRMFYDASRKLYRYRIDADSFCQHTQVWAVLAGSRDTEFRKHLMEMVDRDKTLLPCSFPMQYYLFRAFEVAGLYEKTKGLWDVWKVILEQHLSTVPETPTGARSDCHAWGAWMLYEYPAKVLGVMPDEAGWKKILIRPLALYWNTADGRACVPDGFIDVRWMCDGCNFTIRCTLNTDRPVLICLPDGKTVCEQGRGKMVTARCCLERKDTIETVKDTL